VLVRQRQEIQTLLRPLERAWDILPQDVEKGWKFPLTSRFGEDTRVCPKSCCEWREP